MNTDPTLRVRVRDAIPGMQEITDRPTDEDVDHIIEIVREADRERMWCAWWAAFEKYDLSGSDGTTRTQVAVRAEFDNWYARF